MNKKSNENNRWYQETGFILIYRTNRTRHYTLRLSMVVVNCNDYFKLF